MTYQLLTAPVGGPVVYKSHALRFGGAELPGGEPQFGGLRRTDDPGEKPRCGHIAGDADTEESRVEVHALGGVAEIAGGSPAEPGARTGTIHGGPGQLRQLVGHHPPPQQFTAGRCFACAGAVLLEVRPRGHTPGGRPADRLQPRRGDARRSNRLAGRTASTMTSTWHYRCYAHPRVIKKA